MLRAVKVGLHVAVAFLAYVCAYQIVLWPGLSWWADMASLQTIALAAIYAGLAAGVEAVFKIERAAWRYVSIPDALKLLRSAFLTAASFLLLTFLFTRAEAIPRSVLLLACILQLCGLAFLRALRRLTHERGLVKALAPILNPRADTAPRLLLVGDVGAADAFLRELARDVQPSYAPAAILGLKSADVGRTVRGVLVAGTLAELESTINAFDFQKRPVAALLFLSASEALQAVSSEVLGRLKVRKLQLLRLPAVTELSAEFATVPRALRELSEEELLARPAVQLDLGRIHELVNGRRVLVTGAAGSIGSEICRQAAAFGCAHLSMLDHSEFGLFKIDDEFSAAHPDLSRRELICDVRDRARVDRCLVEERPDIVFHAAALKHVSIVEHHPCEGALTNVVGTWNVAEASRLAEVGQMVLISTDKAVDPCNVMGATKRLAEAVVRGEQLRAATRFSVVRFGNVLGSAGSVVPVFKMQIARGGPVTVTDPDVERYFMTIPEAVQLVLHATAESASRAEPQPSVFVLDMGDPVKIVDLARNMINLHGLTPGTDIEIQFTGLRPGEKLTEALVDTGETVKGHFGSVMELSDTHFQALTASQVRDIESVARSGNDQRLVELVYAHVSRIRKVQGALAEAG